MIGSLPIIGRRRQRRRQRQKGVVTAEWVVTTPFPVPSPTPKSPGPQVPASPLLDFLDRVGLTETVDDGGVSGGEVSDHAGGAEDAADQDGPPTEEREDP